MGPASVLSYTEITDFVTNDAIRRAAAKLGLGQNQWNPGAKMKIEGKVCVITGAASGIGRAMARRFAAEGAEAIYVADIQEPVLSAVAKEIGGVALLCDSTREADIGALIDQAETASGRIDVFCSNAGVIEIGDEQAPDAEWQLCWNLHVMGHVYAARALAPKMAARGDGYLVNTASAAGLLSHVNSATYSVTKHAAVAFAEWLSINYGAKGLKVSVLCPPAVRTALPEGRRPEDQQGHRPRVKSGD